MRKIDPREFFSSANARYGVLLSPDDNRVILHNEKGDEVIKYVGKKDHEILIAEPFFVGDNFIFHDRDPKGTKTFVVNAVSGKLVATYDSPGARTDAFAVTTKGDRFATLIAGPEPKIAIRWPDGSRIEEKILNLPSEPGWNLRFSPDGKRLSCEIPQPEAHRRIRCRLRQGGPNLYRE